MRDFQDGPASPHFSPLALQGDDLFSNLATAPISAEMREAAVDAPSGHCVAWGIPFAASAYAVLSDRPVHFDLPPSSARWLVFMHTSDQRPLAQDDAGFIRPMRGEGQLNEPAADYVMCYADGTEERLTVRRRHHLGAFRHRWGENCFQSVAHHKPSARRPHHEQTIDEWGFGETRVDGGDYRPWLFWLCAWQNPHPERPIVGLRLEPLNGVVVLAGVTAGQVEDYPLRWRSRRKALLTLPDGDTFDPTIDAHGQLSQIRLDMGQIISAIPRRLYPSADWETTGHNNQPPELSPNEILVEYTAHPAATFYLPAGRCVPATQVEDEGLAGALEPIPPATRPVRLRVVEKAGGRPVPVKLHVHGAHGEYLAPVDRHRLPNASWFQDYSTDFVHQAHFCTYINGEADLRLPLGPVYIEIAKGFEIKPIRKTVEIDASTQEIVIELERVLPWRMRGWVTADTHVHFLSPITALLEGEAEGVNVVNLLASQWGELMTNVGDFDGRSTWGDGEYLVRVGTENRQHVLGHISLLGYSGRIIAPMTTGGPDESALGDPVDCLLMEWARQCRKQGGLVVLPHFPNPRAENAAAVVSGQVDAIEMTSWGNLWGGIDPYSLSDWYRYLNCGYQVAAVGGTDKMAADTAVGTVRTYARIPAGRPFSYDNWMEAVRRAETFVTYGPLLEFMVEGQPMGSQLDLPAGGGAVDVSWEVASATIPISRVDLMVNGEVRESQTVPAGGAAGHWSCHLDQSSWLALLVRGRYPEQPEIVAAHSSAVMVTVGNTRLMAAADAVTILEQIEGALAFLDTVGTRAEDRVYKRMRQTLVSVHRTLHNRLHQTGQYHTHSPAADHPAHH